MEEEAIIGAHCSSPPRLESLLSVQQPHVRYCREHNVLESTESAKHEGCIEVASKLLARSHMLS